MSVLRDATVDELPEISALCLSSKAFWGYDAGFMGACVDELTLRPEDLRTSRVAVLEDAGHLCAMCQVRCDGQDAELLKLFVATDQMGRGLGRNLMRWAVSVAREQGAVRLTIEADPGAEPFYRRFGARRIGTVPSGSVAGRSLPLLEVLL